MRQRAWRAFQAGAHCTPFATALRRIYWKPTLMCASFRSCSGKSESSSRGFVLGRFANAGRLMRKPKSCASARIGKPSTTLPVVNFLVERLSARKAAVGTGLISKNSSVRLEAKARSDRRPAVLRATNWPSPYISTRLRRSEQITPGSFSKSIPMQDRGRSFSDRTTVSISFSVTLNDGRLYTWIEVRKCTLA